MTNNLLLLSAGLMAGSVGLALVALSGAVAAPGHMAPAPASGHQIPAPAGATYPFEGTWIRADRPCTPRATVVRTYTAHEVYSSRNQCAIRRVAGSGGGRSFELLEDCRHNPMHVTESIRMTSPDTLTLKRQVFRLKIPRAVKFARCTAAPALGPAKK